jgi:hypothetical protein
MSSFKRKTHSDQLVPHDTERSAAQCVVHISLLSLTENIERCIYDSPNIRDNEKLQKFLTAPLEFNYTRPIYSTMRSLEFDCRRGIQIRSLGQLAGKYLKRATGFCLNMGPGLFLIKHLSMTVEDSSLCKIQ